MKHLYFGASVLASTTALFALGPSCSKSSDPAPPTNPTDVVNVTLTGPAPTPSGPQLMTAQPVSAFGDAATTDPSDKTPFQQAKEYHDLGQNWVARLLIEKHALGPAGTNEELELLVDICKAQRDGVCVQSCATRLGRKIVFDAGAPPSASGGPPGVATEHPSETPFSKARDLHLKKRDKEARAILEPRVIDGKAPNEEVSLLLTICTDQKDKMCIALCKKQLGQ